MTIANVSEHAGSPHLAGAFFWKFVGNIKAGKIVSGEPLVLRSLGTLNLGEVTRNDNLKRSSETHCGYGAELA
jgi:hypothetical protein